MAVEVANLSQSEIDRRLFGSLWLREAEKIDLSLFDSEDQILIIKCKEQLPVTDEELLSLRKIFNSYKKLDKKFGIKDAEKNIKETKELISTEQALLNLADEVDQVPLVKKYKQDGQVYEIRMYVNPIMDSRSTYDLVSHTQMFNKFNDTEKKVLEKENTVGNLNEKELKIFAKANEKIESMITQTDNFMFIVENTLARQVDFQDGSLPESYDDRMSFWGKVNANVKVDIYNSVNAIIKNSDIQPFRE